MQEKGHPLARHSMNQGVMQKVIHGERRMRTEGRKIQAARARREEAARAEQDFQEKFPREQVDNALNALTSMRANPDSATLEDYQAMESFIDKQMHLRGVTHASPSRNIDIVIVDL